MAEENAENLEGLDDFGDDFGDQLDSFMEGEEEEEGDSELDSFFEDLSTIDDLEMKEEGDESETESESGDAEKPEEEADEAVAVSPAAASAEEEKLNDKKEEKKPDKLKKEKQEKSQRKPLLIPALIVCLVGIVLGAATVAILYFLNMPEGVPEELAEEEIKPAPAAVFKDPEPEPQPVTKPKPDSRGKGTRYYVQVANCVFDDCVKEYRRLLKNHGYKSRMVKSTETSSMAEVVSKQIIGDEASVKLVNQINRNNREAGQAFRTKGKQGYRISMGLFPDLERAGRVRNYLNQEFGKQSFFEIKRATEKITYHRVQAGGYRTKKQAESLRRLLARRDKNFESAFVVSVKR